MKSFKQLTSALALGLALTAGLAQGGHAAGDGTFTSGFFLGPSGRGVGGIREIVACESGPGGGRRTTRKPR